MTELPYHLRGLGPCSEDTLDGQSLCLIASHLKPSLHDLIIISRPTGPSQGTSTELFTHTLETEPETVAEDLRQELWKKNELARTSVSNTRH